jgi:hypothetical protein
VRLILDWRVFHRCQERRYGIGDGIGARLGRQVMTCA